MSEFEFRRGDRISVPVDTIGIDPQFLGQPGTIIRQVANYGSGQYYEVQFDHVAPPFGEPYGDGNYWRVDRSNILMTRARAWTPQEIEEFLNA